MESHEFVLANIPMTYWEDGEELIINYVENTLNIDIKEVKLCPFLPGRAIICSENKIADFSEVAKIISETPLESCTLEVLETRKETAVVVENLDVTKLSEEFACLYFESVFADGRAVICSSHSWPDQNLAVFTFQLSDMPVVQKILEQPRHLALPSENYHISVGPFYYNFHDQLEKISSDKSRLQISERKNRSQDCFRKPSVQGQHRNIRTGFNSYLGIGVNKLDRKFSLDRNVERESLVKEYREHFESEDEMSQSSEEDEEVEMKSEVEEDDEAVEEQEEESDSLLSGEDEEGGTVDEEKEDEKEAVGAHLGARQKNTSTSIRENRRKEFFSSSEGKKMCHENRGNDGQFHGDQRSMKVDKHLEKVIKYANHDKPVSGQCSRRLTSETKSRRGRQGKAENKGRESSGQQRPDKKFHRGHQNVFQINMSRGDMDMGKQSCVADSCLFETNVPMTTSFTKTRPSVPCVKPSIRGRGGTTYRTGRGKKSQTSADVEKGLFSKTYNKEHELHDHQLQCQKSVGKSETPELHTPHEPAILDTSVFKRLAEKEEELKKIKEETARLREKPEVTTAHVQLACWQFELLPDFFGQFEDCRVHYNRAKKTACLEGPEVKVQKRQKDLLRELKNWRHEEIQLTSFVQSIIGSEKAKAFLDKLQSSELKGVRLFHHEKSLIITAKDNDKLNEAVDKLRERLNYEETRTFKTALPIDQLRDLQSRLLAKLVKVSWNVDGTRISVEGITDDVSMAMDDVDKFLNEYAEHEKEFRISGVPAKFICKHMDYRIKILPNVEVTDLVMTDQTISVKFKGRGGHTNQIYRQLEDLKKEITSKQWDIKSEWGKNEDLWLLTQGFHSEKVKEKIQMFEFNNKCCVIPTLPKLDSFKMNTLQFKQPAKPSTPSQPKSQKPRPSPRKVNEGSKFSLTPTCELVVKSSGNIVLDTSDLLVTVLAPNVDLRKTRVGQAFNRACSSLWKQLKAEQEAHPTDQVLTTKGPFRGLKCQAICHVILSPWDPNKSPAQLDNAVKLVLRQAVSLGVKSVSFPPLGCGRAFQFPPLQVAQTVIASIKSENLGQTLNRITLLAPDLELFKELKGVIVQSSLVSIPQQQEVVAGPEQDSDSDEKESYSSEGDEESDDDGQVEIALQETSSWNICIVTTRSSGLDKIWSQLKQEIDKICLHTDYFNQSIVEFCPKETRQKIIGKAKELSVWVQRSPNPKTKKLGYSVKGEPDTVKQMKDFIRHEFEEISKHLPKKRIYSSDTPKRGFVEFLKHAAESDEPFPSYWKLNKSEKFWKKFMPGLFKKDNKEFLVDVDSQTKAAIQELVAQTFDPKLVGAGRDAKGLNHGGIKVLDVKRVENPNLFEAYQAQRKRLFKKMHDQGKICPDIGKIHGSKGRVVTTELLDDFMKKELYYEVNEHYLFHGTKKERIEVLTKSGIDPRVSSGEAMFGKGIYTAEKFMKSDQYTDSKKQRTPAGTKLYMILARVLLGNVFLCNDQHKSVALPGSEKLIRPPCVHCYQDKCSCKNQALFDSVMGDGKWNFREFVVYDQSSCYPEYIITYKRV